MVAGQGRSDHVSIRSKVEGNEYSVCRLYGFKDRFWGVHSYADMIACQPRIPPSFVNPIVVV